MQVTYCHVILNWEKMTSYEKSTQNLPLKSQLSGEFQRFNNAIDGSIDMLKKSSVSKKFQLKWKIVKNFSRFKQRAALRKLFHSHQPSPFSPTPQDKILLSLWNKNFLKKILINTKTFAVKLLLKCNSWVSRNSAVRIFFVTPNRNMFAEKFVK